MNDIFGYTLEFSYRDTGLDTKLVKIWSQGFNVAWNHMFDTIDVLFGWAAVQYIKRN